MSYKVACLIFVAAAVMFCGCSENKKYNSIYTTNVEVGDVTAPASAMEVDLVEDLSAKRAEYVKAVKVLESYYQRTGDHQKGLWANRELELLGQAPQYTYVAAGQIANKNLRAIDSIEAADELYAQADSLYGKARFLALVGDKPKLRQALSMFNEVISTYPTSDKIDDAAYKAGIIYQSFSDYKLATTYYQRAYEWNPNTPYPARFKAAYLMDKKLGMNTKALELYKASIQLESAYGANVDYANMRIKSLTNSKEVSQAKSEIK